MPTTPNNGLRYPDLSSAPNVPLDVGNLASDLDTRLVGRFTSTANRDAAITAPQTGMVVAVAGFLQVYRGGVWTTDLTDKPTFSTLSLTANYTTSGAPWGPAQVVQQGVRMRLQGSVTNTFTPTSGTKGTEYQLGTLPGGTAPLNPVAAAVAWGDGVSFVGSAILVVRPDLSVNFIPPANFTTGAIHTMSLAVRADWISGS